MLVNRCVRLRNSAGSCNNLFKGRSETLRPGGIIAALKKADGTPIDELKQLELGKVKQLLDNDLIVESNKASKLLEALNNDEFFDIIFEIAE